jgi:hypothetical protein
MSLQAYVEKRMSDGVASARVIHAEIVRPSEVATKGTAARPTAQLENDLRALIVPDLMTLTLWNGTAPDAREELVETRILNRKAAAADVTAYVALDMLEARINGLVRRINKRGGDPFGAEAGKAERDTETRTTGPALWQTWNIERPTVAQVRGLMR